MFSVQKEPLFTQADGSAEGVYPINYTITVPMSLLWRTSSKGPAVLSCNQAYSVLLASAGLQGVQQFTER